MCIRDSPSYMGLLKYKSIGQINAALRKLGFTDVRETSEGAAMVTAEYARLLDCLLYTSQGFYFFLGCASFYKGIGKEGLADEAAVVCKGGF